MSNGLSLPITLNLKDFNARLGEVRTGLSALASAPLKALGNAFAPAIDGVKRFGAAVQNAQLAIGAASVAIGAGIREAVNAYNADQAAAARVAATFGTNAEAVNAALNGIATSTDRAMGDLQGMAAQFGVLINNAGLSKSATAEMATQFTQTALDISARFGKPLEQVFEDLGQGLKGMERGVKDYGIVLTDAAKESEARRLGFNPDDLNEQQTALINLNIITRQTAQFQGAAAGAAGTLRDALRRVKDQTGELYGAIGGALEPALLPLVNGILDVVKSTRLWIEANPEMSATVGKAVIAFAAFGTALASVGGFIAYGLPLISALAAPFSMLLNPIAALIAGFTFLLGGTALGGVIDGFAQFVANGEGIQTVFAGIQSGIDAIGGAFEVLRAGIASIGTNVFTRLEADAGSAGNFFAELGARISSVMTAAFEFILPIAESVVTNVIDIFEGIPTVIQAIGEAFDAFGAFFSGIVEIITGETMNVGTGFNDLQSIATGVITFLTDLLKAPALIRALGVIRIALASVAAGFALLYESGQLVVAGLEIIFVGVMKPIQNMLDTLSYVSTTAKVMADQLRAFNDGLIADGVARSENAQQQIGAIATKLATETASALDQINDPTSTINRIKQEETARKRLTEEAKRLSTEDKNQTAQEKERAAQLKRINDNAIAFEKEKSDEANKADTLSKKQQEDIKRATDEAVQAEMSVLDARAKANGLLSDELALLQRRMEMELASARKRFATEEELAQIKRKYAAQATGMKEQRQRENESNSASIENDLDSTKRQAHRATGADLETDIEDIKAKFADELKKVKNGVDFNNVMENMRIQLGMVIDKQKENVAKIQEDLAQENADYAKKVKQSKGNLDQSDVEAHVAREDDLRSALFEGRERLSNLKGKATEAAHAASVYGRKNLKIAEDDQAATEASGGAIPDVPLTPLEQAKNVLKGLGDKFQDLVSKLGEKLEGFGDQVLALANATAELVKTADVFPRISTSLEELVTNQSAFGTALNEFGDTVVSQIGSVTQLLNDQTNVLKTQSEKIREYEYAARKMDDLVASFGGI